MKTFKQFLLDDYAVGDKVGLKGLSNTGTVKKVIKKKTGTHYKVKGMGLASAFKWSHNALQGSM